MQNCKNVKIYKKKMYKLYFGYFVVIQKIKFQQNWNVKQFFMFINVD